MLCNESQSSAASGALTMRERKMQEWKMREYIPGVENAGATKYGKPSEKYSKVPDKIWLSLQCRGFPHPNLFVFLGYVYSITIDSVSDVSRVTCGLAIGRAKKRGHLTNDKRINMCLQKFDSHAYR